ncbi:MAG: methionyl-tRNA formyltransferase [Verrucomicrobiota bacterium]|nr:methionyl-tRNA formyltransferase [Verrucomicrobiota bacterium]
MSRLKIVLLGSGELACPLLEAVVLEGRDELAGVITQPDRPGGRGLGAKACAIKPLARHYHLSILDPMNVNDEASVALVAALDPDVLVVASYGQFLGADLLAIPRLGTLNVHPSMLPKYRGASPIQWALANGDAQTGVSVLYVTPRMDAGDLLAQEAVAIDPADTYLSLAPRLAQKGAELLQGVLSVLHSGEKPTAIPQDESKVTFAHKLKKEDGRIVWESSADTIVNRWRGFHPWPGAYTTLPDGTLLKVHELKREEGQTDEPPGTVLRCDKGGLCVAAGVGVVRLLSVQPEGGKVMTSDAFICGRYLGRGERLGGASPFVK